MKEIKIFQNELFGQIRVAGTSERPLFCLADVCKALDIKNPSDCKNRLKQDGVVTTEVIDSMNRLQQAMFITESNLYKCVFQSRRPDAEKFQDWVCDDVLPSIRKKGAYMTEDTIEKALTSPDFLIQLATNLKEEQGRRKIAEAKAALLEELAKEQAPKVIFANAVETSKRSCLVSELAKILNQNGVNMGQNRLFQWLRDSGYLCSKGEYYNQPTQRSMDMDLFEITQRTVNKPNGDILVSTTTKVTGKGQSYFVNKFLKSA